MAKVLAKVIHLMDLSKFNTSILESLIKLTKKRDILLDELKKLEAAITSVTSGGKSEPATVRRRRSTGRRRSAAPAAEIKTIKDSEAQTGETGRAQSPDPCRAAGRWRQGRCRQGALCQAWCKKSKRSCLVQQHWQETWHNPACGSGPLSPQTGRIVSASAGRWCRKIPAASDILIKV